MFKKLKQWLTNIHCNGNWLQRALLYIIVSLLTYAIIGGIIACICVAPIILVFALVVSLMWLGMWWMGYALVDMITEFVRDKQRNK